MKSLQFSIQIQAPRKLVWDTLQDSEKYKVWTAEFCAGSYFNGSWQEGEQIRFLSPEGSGMTAVIAVNRPYELLSIKHLGYIHNGVDDTESEEVRSWAPAFENYSFSESDGNTTLTVTLDITDEYEQYMQNTWPKALAILKALCETAAV